MKKKIAITSLLFLVGMAFAFLSRSQPQSAPQNPNSSQDAEQIETGLQSSLFAALELPQGSRIEIENCVISQFIRPINVCSDGSLSDMVTTVIGVKEADHIKRSNLGSRASLEFVFVEKVANTNIAIRAILRSNKTEKEKERLTQSLLHENGIVSKKTYLQCDGHERLTIGSPHSKSLFFPSGLEKELEKQLGAFHVQCRSEKQL